MPNDTKPERKKPSFGYFHDGKFQGLDLEPTSPILDRVLPVMPEHDPLEAASRFSDRLREDSQ